MSPSGVARRTPGSPEFRSRRHGGGAAARRPVALILPRFPVVTETFVLREIQEMERQGRAPLVVPLLRQQEGLVHEGARPWVARARYTPFLSSAVLASNLRLLARRPGLYLRLAGRVLFGSLRHPRLLAGSLGFFPKTVHLAEILQSEGVGHIHAQFASHSATSARILHEITGLPYSFTAHAHAIFVPWRRGLLRWKMERASFVRVISEFARDHLRSLYPDLPPGLIRTIHVGIPVEDYDATSASGEDPCPHSRAEGDALPRLVTVASLEPYKGLHVLIEACRRLAEEGRAFHLDVAGEGSQRGALEALIEQAGLASRIHLLGALPMHEVRTLLSRGRLFVLPSIPQKDGKMEGIPVALMEAMATGLPVVTSRLSGIPELVEDGITGRLVPPGDPAALARALAEVLDHPKDADRRARAGRARVEGDFGLSPCTRELLCAVSEEERPVPESAARALARLEIPLLREQGFQVSRVHERRDSLVIEGPCSDDGLSRPVVVKLHRDRAGQSRPPVERARWEAAWLELLERAGGRREGRWRVPRLLGLDRDRAALVMEGCTDPSVDQEIRRLRFSSPSGCRELEEILRRCGAWLRWFQDQPLAEPADARWLLEDLLNRGLRALEPACAAGLPRPLATELEERLPHLAAWVPREALRPGPRHGDFWPGNLFHDAATGRVTAIDFEGAGAGLPPEDAGRFLVHLELFHAFPLLGRRVARHREAFLSGWAGVKGLDPSAMSLARTVAALELLVQEPEGASPLLRFRRRRVLLRICRHG